MFLYKILITLFFLVLLTVSCSKDNPLQPSVSTTKLSTFGEIQQQVFTPSCAFSGCHAGSTPAGNLNLSAGNSYSQLVNVQAQFLFTDKMRVSPDSSSQSALILTLITSNPGQRMPQGGTPLSSAVIDSIRKWIDDGALNN
jgi:hypothetical protein